MDEWNFPILCLKVVQDSKQKEIECYFNSKFKRDRHTRMLMLEIFPFIQTVKQHMQAILKL